MANQFYNLNLLQESYNIELGTEPGLTEDYSILYPRTKPTNNQQLKYNAVTGFMEWVDPPSGNVAGSRAIFNSVNPPPNPVDGTLWNEIGSETELWEWDASNALWWSNIKTCDVTLPVINDPTGSQFNTRTGRNINYTNSTIRKIRFINTRWIYMVSLGHNASIWYTYSMRYINNLGQFISMQSFQTQTWNNISTVYRMTNDMNFLNNSGTGAIRYANNVFSFEVNFSSGNDFGSSRPFGTTTVVYRHDRT